ncbi:hypothetical protein HK405_002205 [Cladochytrium tenue]|nr:hypothetical protein HK405_002205 [Cladochytrium tenue]
MAQVVAAYATTSRTHKTIVGARVRGLVSGEAPLDEYFRPQRPGAATEPRPIREDVDRLAPLYIRTSLVAGAQGAPIRICKMALRKCPGMPAFYEVCPIGSGLSLWEVFLPRKHHEAFVAAVAVTKGGIRMAEDDFLVTNPSKVAFPSDDDSKTERALTRRRGRQLAEAISGRVYAALLEFTPSSLRAKALRAADTVRRAMVSTAQRQPLGTRNREASANDDLSALPADEAEDDPMNDAQGDALGDGAKTDDGQSDGPAQ